jgi:hypothetical protein
MKVRVAYVCADGGIPVFGQKGCSIHVQEVIRGLKGQGGQVTLFATRIGGELPTDLSDVIVHQLPAIPKMERSQREQVALGMNPDLRLSLEKSAPFDLVYERYSLWSYGAMEYGCSWVVGGKFTFNFRTGAASGFD